MLFSSTFCLYWLPSFIAVGGLLPATQSRSVERIKLVYRAPTYLQQLADTTSFPVTYATSLPTPTPDQWEKDYERYNRFLTPEIKRTQAGLSFAVNGVQTWWCQPSASPHAQLDITTRIQDPARVMGNWRSVANRIITHIDSFSVKDQKFYRSATVRAQPAAIALQITDQKFSLSVAGAPKQPQLTKKYALVNQRYLVLYGAAKLNSAISQVGIDAEGHLILHNCTVVERKIPGRYLTYQTTIWQTILARN